MPLGEVYLSPYPLSTVRNRGCRDALNLLMALPLLFWSLLSLDFDTQNPLKSSQNRPSIHHLLLSTSFLNRFFITFLSNDQQPEPLKFKRPHFLNILPSSTLYKLRYIDIQFSTQHSSILDLKIIKINQTRC